MLLDALREKLTIDVRSSGFTDPNSRTIVVMFGDEEISRTFIDVSDHPEYEG